MSSALEEKKGTGPSKTIWLFASAAVAALVIAVAGGIALFGGGEASPVAAPLELDAGGEELLASCIVFSAEELEKVAELAFAGTVTAVDGAVVRLDVDHWFRGGEAAEVVLNAPRGMEALIGGIPFLVGDQYLITARGSDVNYCGFSGVTTPSYRAAFDEAFAQG